MKVLCGKLAGLDKVYWWAIPETIRHSFLYKSGDYAIVESNRDYAMVKVIAIVDVDERYVHTLTGRCKGSLANVVKFLFRSEVRAD